VFQPAVPIVKVLDRIHKSEYVLPAIQREFVWSTDQICRLFDSLMRGYPIGTFLFWNVEAENTGKFTFYDFITDFHEKDAPTASPKQVPVGRGVIAILDGQQRLTALNIGLYGSHAERQARKWQNNPDAYPKKHLYLNLQSLPSDDELGMAYDFRFLTDVQAAPVEGQPDAWFRVKDVLKFANSGPAINSEIVRRGLSVDGERPFEVLWSLYRAVWETNSINAFLVESQDADMVLDVFVRVNSGGTALSYSDLLLSMTTNQWTTLDAREEVQGLLTKLNDVGAGFKFSKDDVLKAGLVLTEIGDVGFKVSNFTRQNVVTMEEQWPQIKSALQIAAELLSSFGFSEQTMSASSPVIPIAYYVNRRGLKASYLTSSEAASDRALIQSWVSKSLVKRGVWGSGLDTLHGRLRQCIKTHGAAAFPVHEIESEMANMGKSLRFESTEINELLDLEYGKKRTFAVLAMLYPGLDLTKSHHVDHIFPRSRFYRKRLSQAGVSSDMIDEFVSKADGIANLQLLPGLPNIEKQDKLPHEWLHGPHFVSDAKRTQYVLDNDLDGIPESILGFLDFYDARRKKLEERLKSILGV
jgi:hypothetical protein